MLLRSVQLLSCLLCLAALPSTSSRWVALHLVLPGSAPSSCSVLLILLLLRRPAFGLGVFLSEPGGEAQSACEIALANEYIMIDTAQGYDNETDVGGALKGKDRSSIFVVTKLAGENHSSAAVHSSIKESLEKLGTDYVDLFLIHNPRGENCLETWAAMLEVKAAGQARAVGVSNFGVAHLKMLKAEGLEMPEVNQVELHPWHQQRLLVDYHATEGIATMVRPPLRPARADLRSPALPCAEKETGWLTAATAAGVLPDGAREEVRRPSDREDRRGPRQVRGADHDPLVLPAWLHHHPEVSHGAAHHRQRWNLRLLPLG